MAGRQGRAATAADDDNEPEDYVFYGTKLHDEDGEATALPSGTRSDPSTVRSLPVHQQVATDDQGRKRFHGAFTGGFSAGYYNTVGSKVCAAGCFWGCDDQSRTTGRIVTTQCHRSAGTALITFTCPEV
jgi:G patch domain-containing protein 1